MSENKNLTHNSKKSFLQNPVEHIDITSFDARKIISSMEKMSFVSRETANAANIFNEMIQDKDCTIFLTLAGSTSAAGCMNIYKDLVKYNMVDAIIATGASIVDMDFFEALGFKHYQGSQFQDDTELRKNYIDRIYDTYIDEEELQELESALVALSELDATTIEWRVQNIVSVMSGNGTLADNHHHHAAAAATAVAAAFAAVAACFLCILQGQLYGRFHSQLGGWGGDRIRGILPELAFGAEPSTATRGSDCGVRFAQDSHPVRVPEHLVNVFCHRAPNCSQCL